MLWGLLLLLAVGVIGGIALGDAGSLGGLDGATFASLVASVALLIYFIAPYLSGGRGSLSKGVKDLFVWAGIMLVLVAIYAFRDDAKFLYQRIAGELLPPGHTLSISDDSGLNQAVRIRRQPNGHFAARAAVNGQTIMLLVDTGASSIVLTQSDARAVGIDVDNLRYATPARTANGIAYTAATQIQTISVGSITMNGLNVMVAKPGALSESLLGMNFLTRLRSYEFTGDFLTLRG